MTPDEGALLGIAIACVLAVLCVLSLAVAAAGVVYWRRRGRSDAPAARVPAKPKAQPVAHLELVPTEEDTSPGPPQRYHLKPKTTVFGRDAILCDYPLEHESVSRVHARVERQPDETFMLFDEGSTSGVWVNYKPVSEIGAVLAPGDLVNLGKVQLRFGVALVDAEPQAPSALVTKSGRLGAADWRPRHPAPAAGRGDVAPAAPAPADPHTTLPMDSPPSGLTDTVRERVVGDSEPPASGQTT